MANGFSKIINESFDSYVKRITESDLSEESWGKTHKRKSMKEAAPKKASADHKWGDKSVKSQLALPENQKKLNDMMKSGRNWRDMKNDFVQLIQSLDCTDKNKKQTIMKINGIKNENAFYSTVATYLTGIKAESLKEGVEGQRVLQVSMDVLLGDGESGEDVINKIKQNTDLDILGYTSEYDMTSEYEKYGWFEESLAKTKSLDEAVPKDLMSRIKDTEGYPRRGRTGYDWEKQERTYPYDLDYANADSQEITAQDVMRMKRKGEDLSDIWVLIPGPKMYSGREGKDQLIRLDKLGNPDMDFSTDSPRVNQALKTTLNKAKKIYKGDIRNVSETQPEKWAERTSDENRRMFNRRLGQKRPSRWSWDDHKDFHRRAERHNQEIAKARKEYENGDISRKEMEQRIASAKENRYSKYDARALNNYKQDQADARYYDSNATNKVPEFKRVKRDLVDAKDDLAREQQALEKAKAGAGYENSYVTTKIEELKKKMASLQAELERYEQRLADDPQQKDIDDAQRRIDNTNQLIAQNQATIDKLLRRSKTESLRRVRKHK